MKFGGLVQTAEVDRICEEIDNIAERYTLIDKIGSGGAATVLKAKDNVTGEIWAIKELDKKNVVEDASQAAVMLQVSHPNIVWWKELLATKETFYLVMEFVPGGELLDRLLAQENTQFSEKDAADIIRQLCSAIKHMHLRGIVHCDLKCENILCDTGPDGNLIVKITDFGFAQIIDGEHLLHKQCGTEQYMAPEVLKLRVMDGYTQSVDMWSLGVIIYILLCGSPPFHGGRKGTDAQKAARQQENILTANYSFHPGKWGNISEQAKDLVRSLLKLEPTERLTAEQVLSHPWLKGEAKTVPIIWEDLFKYNKRRGQYKLASHSIAGALMHCTSPYVATSVSAVDSQQAELIQEGSIQQHVSMVLSPNSDLRLEGVHYLSEISRKPEFRKAIMEEGGLRALCTLAKSPNVTPSEQRFIAFAFFHLTQDHWYQISFVHQGALPVLVALAHSERESVRNQAVHAIANLAINRALSNQVVDSGCLRPLLTLASSDFHELRTDAICALDVLATNPSHCSQIVKALTEMVRDVKRDVSEQLCKVASIIADLALSEANRSNLVAAGIVEPLTRLLEIAACSPVESHRPKHRRQRSHTGTLGRWDLHTVNAVGALAQHLADLNVGTDQSANVTSKTQEYLSSMRSRELDQQLRFCVQWAMDAFQQRPSPSTTISKVVMGKASRNVKVSIDGLQARNDSFWLETAIASSAVGVGRWYWEMTVVTEGDIRVGWACDSVKFDHPEMGTSVGTVLGSYSFGGAYGHKWDGLGESYENYGRRWTSGQVVGCYLTVQDKGMEGTTMGFTLNGDDLGPAFVFPLPPTAPAYPQPSRSVAPVANSPFSGQQTPMSPFSPNHPLVSPLLSAAPPPKDLRSPGVFMPPTSSHHRFHAASAPTVHSASGAAHTTSSPTPTTGSTPAPSLPTPTLSSATLLAGSNHHHAHAHAHHNEGRQAHNTVQSPISPTSPNITTSMLLSRSAPQSAPHSPRGGIDMLCAETLRNSLASTAKKSLTTTADMELDRAASNDGAMSVGGSTPRGDEKPNTPTPPPPTQPVGGSRRGSAASALSENDGGLESPSATFPFPLLIPAVSLGRFEQVTINFGATPFVYPIPGYLPVNAACLH